MAAVLVLPILLSIPASAAGRSAARVFDEPRPMVVKAAVADLRRDPVDRTGGFEHDPLQETQLLAGEPVLVWEMRGAWARVEAPEQPEYTTNRRWEGYPGWVRRNALTADLSRYRPPPKNPAGTVEEMRAAVLENARRHLGYPYLWGGRSLHDPSETRVLTGVDCSGLVSWSFYQLGLIVPRDSHEQYMRAEPKDPAALQPGDLIFLARADRPDRMTHVAFYAGDGVVIEAPRSGELVRALPFLERFGVSLAEAKNGLIQGADVLYFGDIVSGLPEVTRRRATQP